MNLLLSLLIGMLGAVLGVYYKESFQIIRNRRNLSAALLLIINEELHDVFNGPFKDIFSLSLFLQMQKDKKLRNLNFEEFKEYEREV